MWRIFQKTHLVVGYGFILLGVLCFPLAIYEREWVLVLSGSVLVLAGVGGVWFLRRVPIVEDYPESER